MMKPAATLFGFRFLKLLESTSRTFLLPILRLPPDLRSAVGQAYLCLRAIDEIEDHPELSPTTKISLLREVSRIFGRDDGFLDTDGLTRLLVGYREPLPEVTRALPDLAWLGSTETQPLIWSSTSRMAKRMAWWVDHDWRVETEEDLDVYTLDVAGRVGLLLSELWHRHDGTESNDEESIGFGRALQAVNMIRNREEDLLRGVDYFPEGWDQDRMIGYARRQIRLADAYMAPLRPGPIREFCSIPLELARATLGVIEAGREKLTRPEVTQVVRGLGIETSSGLGGAQ